MAEHVSMAALRAYCAEHFVVAGTGSRSFNDAEIVDKLNGYIVTLKEAHPDLVLMSGMAEGWDEQIAISAQALEIPYVATVPNEGYGDYYWRRNSRSGKDRYSEFTDYLSKAQCVGYVCDGIYEKGVHSNFVRNTRMVELGDGFLIYDPRSRGTADCFGKIRKAQKPFRIFGPYYA